MGLTKVDSFLTLLAWIETSAAVGPEASALLGRHVGVPIEIEDEPGGDRDNRSSSEHAKQECAGA
jgi:hypothetical protein